MFGYVCWGLSHLRVPLLKLFKPARKRFLCFSILQNRQKIDFCRVRVFWAFDFVFAGARELFPCSGMFVGDFLNYGNPWLNVFKPARKRFLCFLILQNREKIDFCRARVFNFVFAGARESFSCSGMFVRGILK